MKSALAQPPLIIVLSAPSGAGKTTLSGRLLRAHPEARFSVSYTTRAKRPGERDGIDYHFVDNQTFHAMQQKGVLIESAEVHGNWYGSARDVIDDVVAAGGIAVFDVDVQGGISLKKKFPEAVLVFILPPTIEELGRRLRARGTDSEEVIERRIKNARVEMAEGMRAYDHQVKNEHIDAALEEVEKIIAQTRAERGRGA